MKEITRNNQQILLDDEDVDRVIAFERKHRHHWSVMPSKQVSMGHFLGSTLYLSRWLLNYTGPLVVDHIDRNRLNNQKSNLRIITRALNNRNRSDRYTLVGVVGISWVSQNAKWRAQLKLNGTWHFIGYYSSEQEAITAQENYKLAL